MSTQDIENCFEESSYSNERIKNLLEVNSNGLNVKSVTVDVSLFNLRRFPFLGRILESLYPEKTEEKDQHIKILQYLEEGLKFDYDKTKIITKEKPKDTKSSYLVKNIEDNF